ncbi:MAG: dienelactone hydrolase family protein [Bryobacteraceae bacterium]
MGFPAATGPVSTAAITTDSEAIDAREIKIRSGEDEIPAYEAMPKREGPFPVVLVVQEIFGVNEHIKDVCRRLANEGYLAIAMELYARQGDVSKMSDIQEVVQRVVSKVSDEQVLADLDASVEYARASGQGDVDRLGITGFCWGGRIVWLYAAHQPKLRTGAAWYGRLTAGFQKGGKQPVGVAAELKAPVLGLYGGKDQSIPPADIERMREALRAAGKEDSCPIVVYPDAGHAFNADYRPSYHEPSAKDAWARMLAWFKTHGVA